VNKTENKPKELWGKDGTASANKLKGGKSQ